jgi:hypothetical protein
MSENKQRSVFMKILTIPKEQNGYIDEIVILDETKEVYKYSLSNNLDEIKIAIYARTGRNINLERAIWKLNPKLSISVKHLMNSHNVTYSMTTDTKDNIKLIINMRVGNDWYITVYEEIKNKLINCELIRTYTKAFKIAMNILGNSYSDNHIDDE